ncbi:phage holin family protein [Croceibacterium aestuarii]|uniref:phage holin family protein n=1 Tax=Croceibacterium aestuarii TaxID=3064139 RepID=UPI00272DC849|nr:phage holin family protein [Croceibacterium sp. D39]
MNDQRTIVDPPGRRVRAAQADDDNIVDLVGRLTRQGAHLAEEQVSLMQAEVREATTDVKQAVGALAGAAVVGIAGLGVTLMGLAYLVGDWIENVWLGTLIVGAITLIVAAIMYSSGKSKMRATHLKPERTIRTAEDTPDAVTGDMTHSSRRTQ